MISDHNLAIELGLGLGLPETFGASDFDIYRQWECTIGDMKTCLDHLHGDTIQNTNGIEDLEERVSDLEHRFRGLIAHMSEVIRHHNINTAI